MEKMNDRLVQALNKVVAKENQFYYFPPDEIKELSDDPKKSIAIMKNVMGSLEDKKTYLAATLKSLDTAIPKVKALMSGDITIDNLKKFDTVMKAYDDTEERLFDIIKNYY
jgi:hypothetical protein